MQVTHLGHSTVLVEIGSERILLDPGTMSDAWHGLTDLSAILVTHQHPDHADPDELPKLITANPGARVLVEPSVRDIVDLPDRVDALEAGASVDLGAVTVEAVGGRHAVIHPDYPRVGNIGLVVRAEGEPAIFHPGDALEATPEGVDVVAIPAYGPWAALKETIEFARAVGAPKGFLIHDGLLNPTGVELIGTHVGKLGNVELFDAHSGQQF